MFWHTARLLLQLVWVIVLARSLGVEGYGSFSGVSGLALAMSGVVGLGLGLRMYQDVARDPALYSLRWRQTCHGLWWSGGGVALVFLALAHWQFGLFGWGLLLAIALSELVLAPVAAQIAFAYAAHGRIARSAAVPVVVALARLSAVLVFALVGQGDITAYAVWHTCATAAAVIVLKLIHGRELISPAINGSVTWRDVREGLGFSVMWASGLALTSIDKALALKLGGAEVAGHYAAAYRFVGVVALPVDALVTAVMPRLFRAGTGMREHPRILQTLLMVTGVYGLLAGGAVWVGADVLPWLLGDGFAIAAETARAMAIYVPIYCMRILGCSVLLSRGQKWWRFGSEIVALCLMAGVALIRIPSENVHGAVEALVIAESVLLVLVWWRVMTRHPAVAEAAA
jgi:O-antigen/teichoic acid export membrane protein